MLTYCLPPDTSKLKITGITLNGLSIDKVSKTVWRDGVDLKLTPKEYELLCLLASAPGKVFSCDEIRLKIWGQDWDSGSNSIQVYASFLRAKADKPFNTHSICSKPGFGYYLSND